MQTDTYFPKMRRMLLCFSPLILWCFWPVSTLLHGHIAHVIPSLPETDPQILEHWGYADEDHLDKSFQAMDFGLECQHNVTRLLWILHVGLVSACLSSSVKSMEVGTLLTLEENLFDLFLELGDPVSRRMLSVPDLLQGIWYVHLRLEK